jgi:pyruvate,orthophosphate dikinase
VPPSDLKSRTLAVGINAVPGAACGKVAFSAADAEAMAADGTDVILVRKETSPEDVGGMHAAKGILTATGGKTSHAAVVARGWGKCCIVGCEALRIDYDAQRMSVDGKSVGMGDFLTLDGSDGKIYIGQVQLVDPTLPEEYETLMGWCDKRRRLAVRTNADTPEDSANAVRMGAEGIGLCRTEHMFFNTEERRLAMQEMIVADDEPARRAALDKLLPFQRSDFVGIFEAMDGRPVTIRLVDPPLHEFLPHDEAQRKRLSEATGVSIEQIAYRSEQLSEANPMLGHRGCRLCITYPEILEMQVRAIIEAAAEIRIRGGAVLPEIMIPLTIDGKELEILIDRVREVADRIIKQASVKIAYLVGTMIETPRAALLGDRLAEVAEFFSFGTNDLTQTTMGLSRDDAGRFLPDYVDRDKAGIFAEDPFQAIDQDGVGQLVQMAVERGRQARPKIKLGICGEHGGESSSVKFCHRIGLDYVSCSPYRVPIARMAAAQAVIEEKAVTKAAKPTRKRQPAKSATKKASKKKTKAKKKKKKARHR